MSVLDIIYTDAPQRTNGVKNSSWCEDDHHGYYEYFTDFNNWIDGPEGQEIRERYSLLGLSQPSKALYAGDLQAYHQVFKAFCKERKDEVLAASYIQEHFTDEHWFVRNVERFEQLEQCLINKTVVPFVGAGMSVDGGFPSWQGHLRQQGRTSGIDATHIEELLSEGQYEQVIEEIEQKGYRDAFIQELRDVFSKTGSLKDTTLRLAELFTDTIITTNYDHLLEQAFATGETDNIQLIDNTNISDPIAPDKTTIIKLHGDIRTPANCIIGKSQYDTAYGEPDIDLNKDIPKLLAYHFRTSNLLFLGCSLNHDRTMQVFRAVKEQMGDKDRPQHFSLESMPETEEGLRERNNYLLKFGITPIWFPNGAFDSIEQILRLAKNELKYKGFN